MPELSILIPARNEMFLAKTIENIIENIEGDTEVIAVCDGNWPEPGIHDHPRVSLIYHSQSIGQRAATNEAAKMSTARFIMKTDAHCAFDKGFDVKLMADCGPKDTMVPRLYNLHAFDWKCNQCGHRTYQGPTPTKCEKCDNTTNFERVMVWQPRWNRQSDFMRFDNNLHFQYHGDYKNRPEAQGDIAEVMSTLGACWFVHRVRYWEIDGVDEGMGSWGQMGTELACKSWLSGGRMVVNKKTWYSHMFRTQGGFGFPYTISNSDVEKTRKLSRDLWINNAWPKQVRPLSWLVEKFWPVPGWTDEDLSRIKGNGQVSERRRTTLTKGLVYYTDNRLDQHLAESVQMQIERSCNGLPIVSVSLKSVEFGESITLQLERGILTMFKQILAGLEASTADIVFLAEHDILYHPSHFRFSPMRPDVFYYNENTWKVDVETGRALFYYAKQTSGLCAYRSLLLEHYRKRVERVEREGFTRRMGFEPGTHSHPRGVDNYKAERWMSEFPNIDIRHKHNLTQSRWRQDQFRSQKFCQGWTEAEDVPGWGRTLGRFDEFLHDVENGKVLS